MTFDVLSPSVPGEHGPVAPALCRLSPDRSRLAFWVPDANPPGVFVGDVAQGDEMGASARRVYSPADGHIADLAWSGDGQWLGFTLTAGPPPGEVRIVAANITGKTAREFAGMGFSWAGSAATLLIADPAGARLYLYDLELSVEHRLGEIADDGDPHFPPAVSVAPDQRRFALVTRRVADDASSVHLAHHDGRNWHVHPLTQVPETSRRVFPFWSADGHSLALYVIDLERKRSELIALPQREGPGQILYQSDSIDGFTPPATHPDGRLIAHMRTHQAEEGTPAELRLVLIDPVEKSLAPITPDGQIAGRLRWLDGQTLLVEGSTAIWTVRLETNVEFQPAEAAEAGGESAGETAAEAPPSDEPFTRVVVRDADPRFTFVCDIPSDWKRLPLPAKTINFDDPRVMRPLCIFAPEDAPILFTVATRPLVPGATPSAALGFHARVQGFDIGPVSFIRHPAGHGAAALATHIAGEEQMTLRLVMLEDGGHLFSLATMAPAPLWETLQPLLEQIINSFALVDPRGPTTPSFD